MIEWLHSVVQFLNSNAGVVSALALLAAIFVPICIYRKGKRDQRKALQDEYDAMNESYNNMTSDARQEAMRRNALYNQLKRK